jgi:hypothetical protein
MADDQVDKLLAAWRNLRRAVNATLPDYSSRVRAARARLAKDNPTNPGK